MKCSVRNQSGFSIISVTIAMGMIAILLSALSSTMVASVRTTNQIDKDNQFTDLLREMKLAVEKDVNICGAGPTDSINVLSPNLSDEYDVAFYLRNRAGRGTNPDFLIMSEEFLIGSGAAGSGYDRVPGYVIKEMRIKEIESLGGRPLGSFQKANLVIEAWRQQNGQLMPGKVRRIPLLIRQNIAQTAITDCRGGERLVSESDLCLAIGGIYDPLAAAPNPKCQITTVQADAQTLCLDLGGTYDPLANPKCLITTVATPGPPPPPVSGQLVGATYVWRVASGNPWFCTNTWGSGICTPRPNPNNKPDSDCGPGTAEVRAWSNAHAELIQCFQK